MVSTASSKVVLAKAMPACLGRDIIYHCQPEVYDLAWQHVSCYNYTRDKVVNFLSEQTQSLS